MSSSSSPLALILGASGVLAATFDLGASLQAVTIAIGLAAALAVGRSKRKDAVIADLEKSEARLEKSLEGASRRADEEHERRRELERECATWRGKYEEQSRYTAREALETVAAELSVLRGAFGEALSAHGELILKANELAAASTANVIEAVNELKAIRREVITNRERLDELADTG